MWYNAEKNGAGLSGIRHQCRDEDGLLGWGWYEHNGRSYGFERLPDVENKVELQVYWVKHEG